MAKKRGKSGNKTRRRLPARYAPSRGSQARLLSHGVYYIFYLGVAGLVLMGHRLFGWSMGTAVIMAGIWLILVGLMVRVDIGRVIAAEVTEDRLRLRRLWGWSEYPWGRIRGFLYKRPEDGKLVVVKVVPKYADGRIPRFTTLVLSNNRRIRIDRRAIQNTPALLEDIARMVRRTAEGDDAAQSQ